MNTRRNWNENESDDRNNGENSCDPNNNRTGASNNSGSSSKPNSSDSLFYRDLTDRLRQLSFLDFRSCILLWLGAKGYRDICVLKRTGARGRRKIGGADFIGGSPYFPDGQVAVHIRHWQTPVGQRAVDELRGFMFRRDIPFGLIVTNSVFSAQALRAAQGLGGHRLRLVSAPQLAGSLAGLGLGVEPSENGWVVSNSFFGSLGRLRLASSLATDTRLTLSPVGKSHGCSAALDEVSANPPSRPDEPLIWWIVVAVLVSLLVAWVLGLGGWR